jgi:hypothetical protein
MTSLPNGAPEDLNKGARALTHERINVAWLERTGRAGILCDWRTIRHMAIRSFKSGVVRMQSSLLPEHSEV